MHSQSLLWSTPPRRTGWGTGASFKNNPMPSSMRPFLPVTGACTGFSSFQRRAMSHARRVSRPLKPWRHDRSLAPHRPAWCGVCPFGRLEAYARTSALSPERGPPASGGRARFIRSCARTTPDSPMAFQRRLTIQVRPGCPPGGLARVRLVSQLGGSARCLTTRPVLTPCGLGRNCAGWCCAGGTWPG